MNNLQFSQKNDLVVKHKSKKHYSKDLELFKKYFPLNRLMNDLAQANEFTFERYDGQMLYMLLDKVSIEDILKNREVLVNQTQNTENPPEDKSSGAPPVPPVPPTDLNSTNDTLAEEKQKELLEGIDELEEKVEINESNIESLNDELNDKSISIEALENKIVELESKKSVNKKVSKWSN